MFPQGYSSSLRISLNLSVSKYVASVNLKAKELNRAKERGSVVRVISLSVVRANTGVST